MADRNNSPIDAEAPAAGSRPTRSVQAGEALRQKAEALARERAAQVPEDRVPLPSGDIRTTLHELRVHQIELEMQNEELRTAQMRVEAGRARYCELYDLAPVGYCTVSEQGLILEANHAAAALLGAARGALVMQPLSRFILREDQDIYYLHRRKVFECPSAGSGRTGEPQECELRLVKPDGALLWARLTGTAGQEEDGTSICRVVLSDVTGRRKAEEALLQLNADLERRVKERTASLEASEARFRTLFNTAADGLFLRDTDAGRLVLVNQACLDMLGYTLAEFTALRLDELHLPEDLPFVHGAIAESGKRRTASPADIRFRCKDGTLMLGEAHLAAVPGDGPHSVLVSVRDVTERRRMENELRRSRETLRGLLSRLEVAREEERARVARDIHDDLGQSLTAIKLSLHLIGSALGKAGASPELTAVKARARKAIAVVDATTATVQELATQLRPGVLDTLGLGPAVRVEVRRFKARSGIQCRGSVPAALPDLAPAVATASFRILQECLTNVARHSGATRANVWLRVRGNDLLLRVRDNGSGITDEALGGSQSLGLLGMKERAAMLGGEVVLRRHHKGGTLVTVRIPCQNAVPGDAGDGSLVRT